MLRYLTLVALMVTTQHSFAEEADIASDASESALEAEQRRGRALLDKINSKVPRFSLVGTLEALGGGAYAVNGERFLVTEDTHIVGSIASGVAVKVHGFIEGSKMTAQMITVAGSDSVANSQENLGAELLDK
jgi:hypothetical protein